MSKPDAYGIGEAVVSRIDQGFGTRLTWDQVKEVVQHPTEKLTRAQLVEVIAYLGAQLHGARTSVDRDAVLAMTQVEIAVREYQARRP